MFVAIFTRRIFCMNVKWLLCCIIKFIDWSFTCLDLYVVSFHLKYYNRYVYDNFYKRWFLFMIVTWLYLISRSLIDSSLTQICIFFLSIWIIVAGKLLAVFTWRHFFVCLWNDCYLISNSLIESLFSLICMLFLSIWIIVAGMFVALFTRSDYFLWL